jgi:hypothetical protein
MRREIRNRRLKIRRWMRRIRICRRRNGIRMRREM